MAGQVSNALLTHDYFPPRIDSVNVKAVPKRDLKTSGESNILEVTGTGFGDDQFWPKPPTAAATGTPRLGGRIEYMNSDYELSRMLVATDCHHKSGTDISAGSVTLQCSTVHDFSAH